MKTFLDTSSLIKLYHQEEGSDFVMKTVSDGTSGIFLSELTILEFRSAIWKKIREKKITKNAALEVIKCFQTDSVNFQWIMLQSDIIESASQLLMKYGNRGLRTLDSLQFATALTLRDEKCVFLTADKLLNTFFKDELLNVL